MTLDTFLVNSQQKLNGSRWRRVTVAGVDLGGSKIAGVLLDDSGAVRRNRTRE
jgi:activator of 2-hydroxyglutaryl-CoA dehydratase